MPRASPLPSQGDERNRFGQALIRGVSYEIKGNGGIEGYEIERANRAAGGVGIHFALASGSADSDLATIFSAAWLHIEVRKRGLEGQPGENGTTGIFRQAIFCEESGQERSGIAPDHEVA